MNAFHTTMPDTTARNVADLLATHDSLASLHIHCIGIGGCGLSGLARLLQDRGALCSGSDAVETSLTQALQDHGIEVSYEQNGEDLPQHCNMILASAAIGSDHPELLAARERDIPVLTYAEGLGLIQSRHTGVSIAGTHGKSTTAAMLCHVLLQSGLDPSFIIGARCAQIGGGSRTGSHTIPGDGPLAGEPGLLICEACEFNRSFHHHRPRLGLINNVEEDHLDVYGSLEAVVDAFAQFAALLPSAADGGLLLIAHDGAHRREITASLDCAVSTFGFNPSADYTLQYDAQTCGITLHAHGTQVASWKNRLPGEHNALNSAAAAILAHAMGAPWNIVAESMSSFEGVDRRMQRLGERSVDDGAVVVYDDYGHHPTEIEKTLKALRRFERPKRLVCVFQPHQHSRTRFLLDEFATSFAEADIVIVPHIYFVRDSENEKHLVSASDLVDRLRERGVTAMHVYPFDAIVEQLENICRHGDLLVIMGAGPVWTVAHQFLSQAPQQGEPES